MSTDTRPAVPQRIVVDQHGHYWLDWGAHWSMPPISDENVETEVVAVYALTDPARPAPEVVEAILDPAAESTRGNVTGEARPSGQTQTNSAALPTQPCMGVSVSLATPNGHEHTLSHVRDFDSEQKWDCIKAHVTVKTGHLGHHVRVSLPAQREPELG